MQSRGNLRKPIALGHIQEGLPPTAEELEADVQARTRDELEKMKPAIAVSLNVTRVAAAVPVGLLIAHVFAIECETTRRLPCAMGLRDDCVPEGLVLNTCAIADSMYGPGRLLLAWWPSYVTYRLNRHRVVARWCRARWDLGNTSADVLRHRTRVNIHADGKVERAEYRAQHEERQRSQGVVRNAW